MSFGGGSNVGLSGGSGRSEESKKRRKLPYQSKRFIEELNKIEKSYKSSLLSKVGFYNLSAVKVAIQDVRERAYKPHELCKYISLLKIDAGDLNNLLDDAHCQIRKNGVELVKMDENNLGKILSRS